MILLCHEMKWDYWTYIAQPEWFIVGLRTKINVETIYKNREQKKIERQSRTRRR